MDTWSSYCRKHVTEDKQRAKALKEETRNGIRSNSFKRHVEEYASKRGIDLTVSDTTVRTQILQGLLNEVKKDDDIELIPKDMYKSYTQYRTKNRNQIKIKEEHKEEPRDKTQARKKTKVICLDSDDD